MGFFSKLWKKVTKPFKAVGKAIKKTVQKVGKVVNKLGIVGQIGLALILPGVGSMLGSAIGGLGTLGATLGASSNALLSVAGKIITGAAKFATGVGRAFQTVTSGVKNFIGEFGKTAASKLGFNVEGAAGIFFGTEGAFETALQSTKDTWGSSTWGFGDAYNAAVDDTISVLTPTEEVVKPGDPFAAPDATVTDIIPEVPESSLLGPSRPMPEGIPVVDALPPVNIMPTEQIVAQVPNMAALSEIDIPQVEVPDQPSLFSRATTAVKEEVGDFVSTAMAKPISTAIAGYNAYKAYTAEAPEYDYTTSGVVMDVGQGAAFQAAPIDFISSAQMPYGYQASQADRIYQGGAWQRRMMGGFA